MRDQASEIRDQSEFSRIPDPWPLMHDLELIFRTAHRQLRPRTPVPEIKVAFFPFAGLNHTARLHESRLIIRLSDIFTDAPSEVCYSLALILLAKLYRKKIDSAYHRRYRIFILSDEIQERARIARNSRCRIMRAGDDLPWPSLRSQRLIRPSERTVLRRQY